MRAYVAEDAAVPLAIEKPRGARSRIHAMRSQTNGLEDLTDGPGVDQLTCFDSCGVLEPFAVHDRVDAPCLFLHAANLCELFERRDAGLVRHVIFAVSHRFNADGRAVLRYRGAEDELDRRVFENFLLAAGGLGLRVTFGESGGKLRLLGVERDQFSATPSHRSNLTVDVIVIDPDNREANSLCLRLTEPLACAKRLF